VRAGHYACPERQVIYVTGYVSSTVEASREDGTSVKISGK